MQIDDLGQTPGDDVAYSLRAVAATLRFQPGYTLVMLVLQGLLTGWDAVWEMAASVSIGAKIAKNGGLC